MREIGLDEARRANLDLGLNPDGTCLGGITKPLAWCRTITTSSGTTDPFCQDVLAALVGMASARIVDGGQSGDWHGETCCDEYGFFHVSYTRLAEVLNCPSKRVKRAIVKLEKLGIVERFVRIELIPAGGNAVRGQNTLYVRVIPEGLAALSRDSG